MDKIVYEAKVWDLHIHTPRCSKSSGEFKSMSVSDYVSEVKNVLSGKNVGMISFTDHNVISIDVYEEYMRGEFIPFIVGVEIDTIIGPPPVKHVIVYFDITSDNFFEKKIQLIDLNEYLQKEEIQLQELLNKLLSFKTNFVLSPHALKQGIRGIDSGWTDESRTETEAKKYMDQFFCFWEASGHSTIAKGIEFLSDFYEDNRISIVSFSDSSDFSKLKNYLDNPPQMFKSLPSFRGLQMVGTESNRIVSNNCDLIKDKGNLIGKLIINDSTIHFSDKLNTIIGGRGSGKSVLIDAIANSIKEIAISVDRKKFIEELDVCVFNYNGVQLKKDNFQFDYFGQSHVSKIFNGPNYSDAISQYFDDAIKGVEKFNSEEIYDSYKEEFDKLLSDKVELNQRGENISGLIEKYCVTNGSELKLNLLKKNKSKSKLIEFKDPQEMRVLLEKVVPKELQDIPEIKEMIKELMNEVYKQVKMHNEILIEESLLYDSLIDSYFMYKDNFNETNKAKNDIEELFVKHFNSISSKVIRRVNIVNSLLGVNSKVIDFQENFNLFDGNTSEAFRVSWEYKIEKPVYFLVRKLQEYFHNSQVPGCSTESDLRKCIEYYCFASDPVLKSGKRIEDLDSELESLSLEYSLEPVVKYKEVDKYVDIKTLSPGTQTNVLMEYLVCKNTTRPLLIDQPEDNVDNFTIYHKLRQWFIDLKAKRQVIVVTHDANIVINSDSENLIVATKSNETEFKYTYGALEYGSNLETASIILDGGKDAIKRRMTKYGE